MAVCADAAWALDGDGVPDDGNEMLFQGRRRDPETGLYYYRNRMYHAQLGRFLQRDPLGYGDGMNLYEFVGGRPTGAVDPMGLWLDDIHWTLTYRLANKAGIACPRDIADAAWRPDTDRREAKGGFIRAQAWRLLASGALGTATAATGGLGTGVGVAGFVVMEAIAEDRLQMVREWHYPADPDGEIRPGSDMARAKYKAGTRDCDLDAFAEGLHVFKDSYSHQGRPYLEGVGHYRGVGKSWWSGRVGRIDGTLQAALSGSADEVRYWNTTVRIMAMETYEAMLEFKEKCPCACPGPNDTKVNTSSGKHMHKKEVGDWLKVIYPNEDVR